jgi:hypothetical protein
MDNQSPWGHRASCIKHFAIGIIRNPKGGHIMKTRLLIVSIVLFLCAWFAFADETARDGRFIAYDNGTVLDTKTNLMWAAQDNGSDVNWTKAKSYCENYHGGGYTNWRMPTQDELAGLSDKSKAYKGASCGYDVYITKLIRLTCGFVWASETRTAANGVDIAAAFSFSENEREWTGQMLGDSNRALPVRSNK